MIVYGYCQRFLGSLLADYVLAELLVNLLRCGDLACLQTRLGDGGLFFIDNFPAQVDALIADIDTTRTRDQSLYLVLALPAK